MKKSPIRVMCVDDHPLVRDGVTSAVSDQPDMEVVGEAASGEEAVALFAARAGHHVDGPAARRPDERPRRDPLKDTLSDDLIRIIREVHSGRTPLGANVQARLAQRRTQPALTRREVEVIQRVANGERNKEIASELRISEETVEVHLRNIFSKLGVNDRVSAMRVAAHRGIVHLDQTSLG